MQAPRMSETVIISPFIFTADRGRSLVIGGELCRGSDKLCSLLFHILQRSRTTTWTLEQTMARYFWQVVPENTYRQVIHHCFYPDRKSLFSESRALDLGQNAMLILFGRQSEESSPDALSYGFYRLSGNHLTLWLVICFPLNEKI